MKRIPTSHPEIFESTGGWLYTRLKGVDIALGTKDQGEAIAALEIEKAKIDRTGIKARKLRVKDLYPKYKAYKERQRDGKIPKKKQISHNTFREIVSIFENHLLAFFGRGRLSDWTHKTWRKFTSKATLLDLANARKVANGFLEWCKNEGFIEALPDLTEIPHHERRPRRVLTEEEIRLIFKEARVLSLLLFLSLALFMGMRRTEILTLRWENVDFDENYLVVLSEFNKRRRGREIPLNRMAKVFLIETRRSQKEAGIDSPWVFPCKDAPDRRSKSGPRSAWLSCLKRAFPKPKGEPWEDIQWHDLRATYEKYANKSKEHTDTQKEKFADATIAVQKRIYVTMRADDLRGLEDVVQVDGLREIIEEKKY